MRRCIHPVVTIALASGLVGAAERPAGESGAPVFVDRALEAGVEFHHFNGMSGELYFVEMNGAGAALIDYDRDDDLDLYLVQGAMLGDKPLDQATLPPRTPLPLGDRLYRNELVPTGELRFTDVTAASGIDARGYGMGVAVGDVDNDGWPDLYVTNFGSNQLWRNNGDGTFRDATAEAGVDDDRWSVPATFFDFDRDGWLDLYVGNYVDFTIAGHQTCLTAGGARDYCGPLAYQSESDRLFRNLGGGEGGKVRFEDVSAGAGLRGAPGSTLGALAGDFNGDGWPDLYVANDQMRNFMWIHPGPDGGAFADGALMAGTAVNEEGQPEGSMGVDAGDVDNDGDEDLFMTHITRETNTLYRNEGGGFFADATIASELGPASWEHTGFGTGLVDYDNDGRLDVLVVNGAVRLIEGQVRDGDPHPLRQPNLLFRNVGDRFEETAGGEALDIAEVSRGAAFGDLDNDGDTDVLMTNNAGPARLLINQVGQENGWLGVDARDAEGGRAMLGAWIRLVRPDGADLWRRSRSGGSYASAGDARVLFGLGDDPKVERVEIRWPSGGLESWPVSETNRYLILRRGSGESVKEATP